jgi:hypothetical protein
MRANLCNLSIFIPKVGWFTRNSKYGRDGAVWFGPKQVTFSPRRLALTCVNGRFGRERRAPSSDHDLGPPVPPLQLCIELLLTHQRACQNGEFFKIFRLIQIL